MSSVALSPTQLKNKYNDTDKSATTPNMLLELMDELLKYPHVVSETTVSLTTAASTALYTVPTGYQLEVTDVELVGVTAMSGGTSSTLKVNDGTIQLLNGSTGTVFTAGTASSLLAVGAVLSEKQFYAPADVSSAYNKVLAAGAAIVAAVSGTVLTAGAVKVRIIGRLVKV